MKMTRSGFRDPFLFVAYEMIPNIQGNPSYPFPPRNNGLIRQVSHYLHGLYIPGGAGFLPSTALKETLVVNNSIFLHPCCLVGVAL